MSKSKLNIKELEAKFDSLLNSFSEAQINEWDRFDMCSDILANFFAGKFQPAEISEAKTISCYEITPEEVFDYEVNIAC